jgi:hypothetical protein
MPRGDAQNHVIAELSRLGDDPTRLRSAWPRDFAFVGLDSTYGESASWWTPTKRGLRPRHRFGGQTYRPWSLADATRPANSMSSLASTCSPRAVASPANFPHASKNAGMALGNSTVGARSTVRSPPEIPAPGAFSAPGVTEYGAPVVRGWGSGKDEGREPPVSRVTSRPSESGRQDLNLRPLGNRPTIAVLI